MHLTMDFETDGAKLLAAAQRVIADIADSKPLNTAIGEAFGRLIRELVPAAYRPSDAKLVAALREIDAEVRKALSDVGARSRYENLNDGLARSLMLAFEAGFAILGIEFVL